MERWRLLETWDGEPGWNMALDEALLLLPAERPTLRLYTWRPEALSLGYFQRTAEVPAVERAQAVVRRLTGGGAIHHARELTFSIACSAEHALYAGPVRRSYEKVHGAIARALAECGAEAGLRGSQELASDRAGTGMCFEESTDLDLAWDGRKGVGSAQRRTAGRILHHGSVKLGVSALDARVASLEGVDATRMAEALIAAFAEVLGVECERGGVRTEEEMHARERRGFFLSEEFVRRR